MPRETINTLDLIERLEQIEDMLEDSETWGYMFPEIRVEKAEIEGIRDQVSDFQYGETLIHEDYFGDYAKELAEDAEGSEAFIRWPYNHIDWDEASEQLKDDYFEVEYQGEDYYVR